MMALTLLTGIAILAAVFAVVTFGLLIWDFLSGFKVPRVAAASVCLASLATLRQCVKAVSKSRSVRNA